MVGVAANGQIALTKAEQLAPDLITMDIEMPVMDGIDAVRALRKAGSRTPIIMFSTLTERGASATLDALAAGATDYVTKPANVGSVSRSMDQVRSSLVPKIKALAQRRRPSTQPLSGGVTTPITRWAATTAERPAAVRLVAPKPSSTIYQVVVVGSSTGGPEALGTFLRALPRLSVPVVVVQHMPALFTRQLAGRLDRQLVVPVSETAQGQRLEPGTVTIAPGDFHLHLTRPSGKPVARLSQEEPENFCRPAVDVLFRSAAQVYGAQVLGVVLTGMGQDGCRGSRAVVEAGGSVLVQDQESSVVWGMPGSVAKAGLAEQVLPLPALAAAVASRLQVGALGGVR